MLVFRGKKPEMPIFRRARVRQIHFYYALINGLSECLFVRRLYSPPRASRRAARAKCGGRLSASFPTFADAAAAIAGERFQRTQFWLALDR